MSKLIWALLASVAASGFAAAADTAAKKPGTTSYPTKPVRAIISTSASGGTDFAARIYGDKLTQLWGQSVVMDNRPGAVPL